MASLVAVIICISLVITSTNCQSCYTPEYIPGICVSVYDCPNVLQVFQQTLTVATTDYLRSLQCSNGFGKYPHVCCTSNSPPQRSPSLAQAPSWFSSQPQQSTTWLSPVNPVSSGTGHILPTEGYCGGTSLADRIYGGELAGLDEFPWMAILEYEKFSGGKRTSRRKLSCGGALINQRYVLTAAHCLIGEIETRVGYLVGVRLGEYDTSNDVDCLGTICADPVANLGIEAVIPHHEYNENSKNRGNDIGLIRLSSDVVYSEYIKPICLPTSVAYTRAAPNSKYISAGWGRTLRDRQSSVKQRVELPPVDQSTCSLKYNTLGINIDSNQVCAGGVYGKDTCDGDSGNPLMRVSNNHWIVEGIVSFGRGCGLHEWPAVYTRVSSFDQWIKSNLRP